MATTEHTINDALAELLRGTRRMWRMGDIVRSENTAILKKHAKQPDILVIEPNVSPVVIETEVLPAANVEVDAYSRLGEKLETTGRQILSAIAVRMPIRLRTKESSFLTDELADANDLEMAMFAGVSPTQFSRWPTSGWMTGNVIDLSILAQAALIPPEVINKTADKLISEIGDVAALLGEIIEARPGIASMISAELHQEDSLQTRRMAGTILTNAFVFHETLAFGPDDLSTINSLELLRDSTGNITKSAVLSEWRKILEVNYWPIFVIALRIFKIIPALESKSLIERLVHTADRLLQHQMMRSHDLTGAVFQSLIADRKFLAAYYTTPGSASLLSGLAIAIDSPFSKEFWAERNNIKGLRIADFACGTGTLLSTVYHRISQFHEIAGGDASLLHRDIMATVLVGCDVLPAATHLTASMLAGAYPTKQYGRSSIFTVAYGKRSYGIALGSLDLLAPQKTLEVHSPTPDSEEGIGKSDKEVWESLPHTSFDLVIMNPPFTRATGHEGKKVGIANPMFAAFGSTSADQKLMSMMTKRLTKGTSAHGNAGEASIFLLLADRKLKTGGTLALVMPLSLMAGEAWEDSRSLLATNYSDMILVSIAGVGNTEMSFSADTHMGECLVVCRKLKTDKPRATFVILKEPPPSPLVGVNIAEQIRRLISEQNIRRIEDGPLGGTPVNFGNETMGYVLDSSLPLSGGWNLARILDVSLAQTAYQLTNEHRVWLPTMNKVDAVTMFITTVQEIGEIGPYHADINGYTSSGGIRGPFDILKIGPNSVPTYPVIWSHNARVQQAISFEADSEGQPRLVPNQYVQEIVDRKVAEIWKTASHCHFNRDFQFNSQSTGMQFTERKTIGGRAWLSIRLASVEQEKSLVLWANSSLGLLLHWWHANKQQSGRGNITKTALQTLPILDVTKLRQDQIDRAVELFDSISRQKLLPVHEMNIDPIRSEIDTRFMIDILGFPKFIASADGPLDLLRKKMSREPSIRGQK